jgi:hypothetical protein
MCPFANPTTLIFLFYKNYHPITHPTPKNVTFYLRSLSYDFLIYSYNASVVEGWSIFQSRIKYFCFQNAIGYPWRCKKITTLALKLAIVGLAPEMVFLDQKLLSVCAQ